MPITGIGAPSATVLPGHISNIGITYELLMMTVSSTRAIFVVVTLLIVAAGQGFAAPRKWTDKEGRSVTAELLGVEGNVVVVALKNGQRRRLPFDRLSDGDIEWVEAWEEGRSLENALPNPLWPRTVTQPRAAVKPQPSVDGRSRFVTDHFEFDCDGKVSPGVVQDFAQSAEATWRLVDALPLALPDRGAVGRYYIRAFRERADYINAGGSGGSVAFFRPEWEGRQNVLLVPFDSLGTDFFQERATKKVSYDSSILIHELANQILADGTVFFPLWLRVGLGEYIARTPYRSGTFHLGYDERIAEVRERVRLYEHIHVDASIFNPRERLSRASDWFVPTPEMMKGNTSAAELTSRSLVDRHRFFVTSMLMTTYFLHFDGRGEARRVRVYLDRLRAASKYFRTATTEGYLPLSLTGLQNPQPDDVLGALRPFLLGERTPRELQGDVVAAYQKIGILLVERK